MEQIKINNILFNPVDICRIRYSSIFYTYCTCTHILW